MVKRGKLLDKYLKDTKNYIRGEYTREAFLEELDKVPNAEEQFEQLLKENYEWYQLAAHKRVRIHLAKKEFEDKRPNEIQLMIWNNGTQPVIKVISNL